MYCLHAVFLSNIVMDIAYDITFSTKRYSFWRGKRNTSARVMKHKLPVHDVEKKITQKHNQCLASICVVLFC